MTARADQGVAVLAGAAPGFGAALAHGFVAAGYRVSGLSRSRDFGATLESDLPGYRHLTGDVTRPDEMAVCLADVAGREGPPRVLIYNPMRLVIRPFRELEPAAFENAWRTTCFGAMVTAQAALPWLLRDGGTLIFSGATASVRGGARFAALAAAKFALRGLAQSLAREFGPHGVHVVHAVIDGLIQEPQTEARFGPSRDRRMAPEAIAECYLHLAAQPPSAWTHEIDLRPAGETF